MAKAWRTWRCSPQFFICTVLFNVLHISAWDDVGYTRHDFPPGFVFGAGSSAYQVEGAAAEDGRKPSIWDTYLPDGRDIVLGNGDIACDQYHKYKDDVKLMRKLGIDAYRFSISWPRIIPDGHGDVNPKGANYYNNLINELINNGIEAHVTLSHFDIPQALQDEYEGYLSPKFIEDFTAYADFCFKEYGDEFLDPLVYGKYPTIMRKIVGSRLPYFKENDLKILKGSFDFIGLNYYTPYYAQDLPRTTNLYGSDYYGDMSVKIIDPFGAHLTGFTWMKEDGGRTTPKEGLQRMLELIKEKYNGPAIVIHENGYQTKDASFNDTGRVKNLQGMIGSLLQPIRNGCNVKGYFVWSFKDSFELFGGYNVQMGLYGVDFKDKDLRRYPRQSTYWYSSFLKKIGMKSETSNYSYHK